MHIIVASSTFKNGVNTQWFNQISRATAAGDIDTSLIGIIWILSPFLAGVFTYTVPVESP